jgi:acetyl-CoA C-acetyltransferase
MLLNNVFIKTFKRSPVGSFLGGLAKFTSVDLSEAVLKEMVFHHPDYFLLGCVLSAGLGQSPSRQLMGRLGLWNTPSHHINKVCGSGMQAVIDGALRIEVSQSRHVLCGGMESMSNAPYLVMKARQGCRLGHGEFIDHIMYDSLEDKACLYHGETHPGVMGCFAEQTAKDYNLTKDELHDYVLEGLSHFQKHADDHRSAIVPIGGLDMDEQPLKVRPEKFAKLPTPFLKDGIVTPASSSGLCDGAAFIELSFDKTPFQIKGYTNVCVRPQDFLKAPVVAIQKLVHDLSWDLTSVDTFEINEAFAVLPVIAMKELGIPRSKINPWGGACILGHPIGMSGTRIIITLLQIMQKNNLRRGITSLCIGSGEGIAVAIEQI